MTLPVASSGGSTASCFDGKNRAALGAIDRRAACVDGPFDLLVAGASVGSQQDLRRLCGRTECLPPLRKAVCSHAALALAEFDPLARSSHCVESSGTLWLYQDDEGRFGPHSGTSAIGAAVSGGRIRFFWSSVTPINVQRYWQILKRQNRPAVRSDYFRAWPLMKVAVPSHWRAYLSEMGFHRTGYRVTGEISRSADRQSEH